MNPQFDPAPGLHLPQPSVGGQQAAYNPAFFGNPSNQAPVQPAQPAVPTPNAQPGPVSYQQPPQPSAPAPAPAISQPADDGDTIVDDEWVIKAREIASRYHSDPYRQARELSKLKAQYIKARYNKDIKVSEDRS